jgi:hypothetical protein
MPAELTRLLLSSFRSITNFLECATDGRHTTIVSLHSLGKRQQQSLWMLQSVDAGKEWPDSALAALDGIPCLSEMSMLF